MVARGVYLGSIAAGTALVVVLAVTGTGAGGPPWGPGQSKSFDLSLALPTGDAVFNGQLGCGPNVTEEMAFPAPGLLFFNLTQNETGASVNYWVSGFSGSAYESGNTGVGQTWGELGHTVVEFWFTFMACGPYPTVSLGFFGTAVYGGHHGPPLDGPTA